MNWPKVTAVLLILWALGGCVAAAPGPAPNPPPSQDDRNGMH